MYFACKDISNRNWQGKKNCYITKSFSAIEIFWKHYLFFPCHRRKHDWVRAVSRLLGTDSPNLKLSLWLSLFQWKALPVEKTVIVELGESQPCRPLFVLVVECLFCHLMSLLNVQSIVNGIESFCFSMFSFAVVCAMNQYKINAKKVNG